jgi:hypothetical protein
MGAHFTVAIDTTVLFENSIIGGPIDFGFGMTRTRVTIRNCTVSSNIRMGTSTDTAYLDIEDSTLSVSTTNVQISFAGGSNNRVSVARSSIQVTISQNTMAALHIDTSATTNISFVNSTITQTSLSGSTTAYVIDGGVCASGCFITMANVVVTTSAPGQADNHRCIKMGGMSATLVSVTNVSCNLGGMEFGGGTDNTYELAHNKFDQGTIAFGTGGLTAGNLKLYGNQITYTSTTIEYLLSLSSTNGATIEITNNTFDFTKTAGTATLFFPGIAFTAAGKNFTFSSNSVKLRSTSDAIGFVAPTVGGSGQLDYMFITNNDFDVQASSGLAGAVRIDHALLPGLFIANNKFKVVASGDATCLNFVGVHTQPAGADLRQRLYEL